MTYPVGAFWVTLNPSVEETLLTTSFWVVYISAVLYIAFMVLNFDIILGAAAEELTIDNSSMAKTFTVTNTIMGSAAVIAHTTYSYFASEDYKTHQEWEAADVVDPFSA